MLVTSIGKPVTRATRSADKDGQPLYELLVSSTDDLFGTEAVHPCPNFPSEQLNGEALTLSESVVCLVAPIEIKVKESVIVIAFSLTVSLLLGLLVCLNLSEFLFSLLSHQFHLKMVQNSPFYSNQPDLRLSAWE